MVNVGMDTVKSLDQQLKRVASEKLEDCVVCVYQGVAHLVTQVVDRYIHFISISPSEVSLDMPGVFKVLHSLGSDIEVSCWQ